MDPNASLLIVNDPAAHYEERAEALEALAEWLVKGGAFPSDFANLTDEAVEFFAAEGGWDGDVYESIAAAVRCTLANGDLSGLTYLIGGAA